MAHEPEQKKSGLLAKMGNQYSGGLTAAALSALSAWLIITGVKGLAGFTVTRQTALADLIGILVVIAAVRFMKARSESK